MAEYVKVAELSEATKNGMTVIPAGIDRVDICLVYADERFYAVSGICPHKGGPLYRGIVRGNHLICPWHNAGFALDSGKHSFPAGRGLRTFEVRVEDGAVFIRSPQKKDGVGPIKESVVREEDQVL